MTKHEIEAVISEAADTGGWVFIERWSGFGWYSPERVSVTEEVVAIDQSIYGLGTAYLEIGDVLRCEVVQ